MQPAVQEGSSIYTLQFVFSPASIDSTSQLGLQLEELGQCDIKVLATKAGAIVWQRGRQEQQEQESQSLSRSAAAKVSLRG